MFFESKSRRKFLQSLMETSVYSGIPLSIGLPCMAAAASEAIGNTKGDARSLVCIMLAGGNDQSNFIVPTEKTAYAAYKSARGDLALDPAAMQQPFSTGGGEPVLAIHPALKNIGNLIKTGTAAAIANVGVLSEPISHAQWNNGSPSVRVPRQLFSHSDQQALWEVGTPDPSSRTGWLGRIGDLLQASATKDAPSSISVAGSSRLLVGEKSRPFQITPSGAVPIAPFLNPYGILTPELQALLTEENRSNLMENELTAITKRAFAANETIRSAVAKSESLAPFAGGKIGAQLRMIARLIEARTALGHPRQTFFAQQGGYDFHANLASEQSDRLGDLDAAIGDFQLFLEKRGLSDSVLTFTLSDFGRALQSNGKGSDHGWGSHHLLVGGRVKGGQLYGTWPDVGLRTKDDAGNGRLIPSSSMEQYLAPIATWFGVPKDAMKSIFPNSNRFDLDKMKYF